MGRPRLDKQRTEQILDAFLGIIARKGVADTTLDDVANAVDLGRGTVRHFVGNRSDLIAMAAQRLVDRYEQQFRTVALTPPKAGASRRMLAFLFNTSDTLQTEDRAAAALSPQEASDPRVTAVFARGYERYLALIDECLALDSNAKPAARRATAVAVLCLSEMSSQLLGYGFPPTDRTSAAASTRFLIDALASNARA